MRTPKFYIAAIIALAGVGHAAAAPVTGFEALYTANYAACVVPDGTVVDCETAIQAHIDALLSGGVDVTTANATFTALRAEVFAANEPNLDFQALIDALFEQLLPDSGAIGVVDNPDDGVTALSLSPTTDGDDTSPN